MLTTPKSLRLHIAIIGRMNAGKSSVLNLLTGQETAIASSVAGTTTDVVEKNQELHELGPVMWIDTAGLDDDSILGKERTARTQKALEKADIVLVVCEGDDVPHEWIRGIQKPMIYLFNKADLYPNHSEGFWINALDLAARNQVLNRLQDEIKKFLKPCAHSGVLEALIPVGGTLVLIMPIDAEAPVGRLIMPQVQVLRAALDLHLKTIVVQPDEYESALAELKQKPDLVVCDSQVLKQMIEKTPPDVFCTTFSILFARLKGNLNAFIEGAHAIQFLKKGDKVLIAEACTHHAIKDDIARVKIPNLFRQKGFDVQFEWVSGADFPTDLTPYALVVHCGACMFNPAQMKARQAQGEKAHVPMTNYGLCLAALQGYLERITAVFTHQK